MGFMSVLSFYAKVSMGNAEQVRHRARVGLRAGRPFSGRGPRSCRCVPDGGPLGGVQDLLLGLFGTSMHDT